MGATTDSVRVWRDLLRLHACVVEELTAALDITHGLSVSEFDVLINLDPAQPIRHGDLAERVILSRTALTRLVDRLVKRGWVERQPDPADQRAIRIGLTPAGRELRRNAARTNAHVVRRHFAPLDTAHLSEFDGLLRQLRSTNNRTHDATTDSPTTDEGDLS